MQGIISTKFLLHQTRDNIISAFSYSQLYFSKFNYEWYAKQQSLMDYIQSIRSCTVTLLPKKHWKPAKTSNPPAAAPPAPKNQVCHSDWQLLDVLGTTFPVGCLWHCLTSNRVLANVKIYECLFAIFCFIFKAKLSPKPKLSSAANQIHSRSRGISDADTPINLLVRQPAAGCSRK